MRAFWLGLAFVITMLGAATAQAQDSAFYTVTYVEVGLKAESQAREALAAYRDAGRKDAVAMTLLQRIDRKNQFVVLGTWKDQKAYETQAAGASAKQLADKLAPIQIAPADTRQHNALTVAPGTAGGRNTVYAVTHVDVIPPQKDNAIAALKDLVTDSRKQDGSVRYDIWQQTNRANHFSSVAAWASRKAFDAHQDSAPAKTFRTKLAAMTGALYDERLYRVVK